MVFLTASKQITSLIGSPLLRFGLAARSSNLFLPFGGGGGGPSSALPVISSLEQKQRDTPYLDMTLLIPFSQKLLSLALYDESQKVVSRHFREQEKEDGSSMLKSLYQKEQSSSPSNDTDDGLSTTTNEELSNLRIQAYNEVIRKSLLPQESYSNLQAWMGHLRILKWARAEFLISKYGPMVKEAMDAYPQLRASPQFQRNPKHNFLLQLARGRLVLPQTNTKSSTDDNDKTSATTTMLLPTTETIVKAFDMKDWATEKNSQALHESTRLILDKISSSQNPITDNNDDSSAAENNTTTMEDVSTEELLHCLSGGHVQSCGPLNAICEEANLYQLWTKEYVQHLGDYLLQEYAFNNKTSIVDIGAGDGLLIRYLQEYMEGKLKKAKRGRKTKHAATMPTMVSTDDGSWGIFAKAKVEKLNVEGALEKYGKKNNQDDDESLVVVLCSWMPQQVDWTAQFRQSNVDEYILIGEADDGSCGHGWETWGNPIFAPTPKESSDRTTTTTTQPPAFQQDGYQRWDMDSLVPFQFSRFDSALSRSSKTVSFRRKQPSTKRHKR
mmetsp:Transcript_19407/g.47937  ORF Transcript_19407/g.47937 Transcript_19407/m.47937 type:complete len:555 (-) Transcript_19407:39-1703(-)